MSPGARWGLVVVCILFIVFLILGFTVPVKIQSYTRQEVFTDYRTRIEKEPYDVAETYSEPYTETVTKYRQECYTVMIQVPCGTYVCDQDCHPRPRPEPRPRPGPNTPPAPPPLPPVPPPQDCHPRICTRYCPEAQLTCNSVPYPEEVTKYREKQRTVTKWRDKEVREPFTNYRTVTEYQKVPLFSP